MHKAVLALGMLSLPRIKYNGTERHYDSDINSISETLLKAMFWLLGMISLHKVA